MPRLTLLALGCLSAAVLLPLTRAAEAQTEQRFERTISRTVSYKYLLHHPEGYAADTAKRWPVILFLHGSGERGDDVWKVAKHGPPKLIREPGDSPAAKLLRENFIVVSPQCPTGKWWDTDGLLGLLDEVTAKNRVDTSRVYLTGLSMGGFGAWNLGTANPDRFAALVPICGGGDFTAVSLGFAHKKDALLSLPIWAFHGAKDPAVPLGESERMVERLKKAKVESIQLTVYPEAVHDSWTETYNNPELYTWLLKHARKPNAKAP